VCGNVFLNVQLIYVNYKWQGPANDTNDLRTVNYIRHKRTKEAWKQKT